jgi:hypothetical protein
MTDAHAHPSSYEPPRIEARADLARPLIGAVSQPLQSAVFRPSHDDERQR